jgi:hypothetical protein
VDQDATTKKCIDVGVYESRSIHKKTEETKLVTSFQETKK